MNKNCWFIIIGGALWGTTGIFTKIFSVYFGISAFEMCFAKMFSTAVIMFAWLMVFDRSALKFKLKDIWMFLGSGILGHCLFTYCYFISIETNGMAVAAVLLYTAPVFVTLMSALLFSSRITLTKFTAMIAAVVGCALVSGVISGSVKNITAYGIGIGLASGFGYSLYTVFGRFALNAGYKSSTVAFYTFLFASLGSVTVSFFGGTIFPKTEKSTAVLLLLILVFAAVTGVVPYLFYNLGLKKTDPPVASVLASVEPVVAALIGIFAFKEPVNTPIVIGIILVVLSVLMGGAGGSKRRGPKIKYI